MGGILDGISVPERRQIEHLRRLYGPQFRPIQGRTAHFTDAADRVLDRNEGNGAPEGLSRLVTPPDGLHFDQGPHRIVDSHKPRFCRQGVQPVANGVEPLGSAVDHPVDGRGRMGPDHFGPFLVQALMQDEDHEEVGHRLTEALEGVNDDRSVTKRKELLGHRPVHAGARAARDEDEKSHAARGQISRGRLRNARRWRSSRSR